MDLLKCLAAGDIMIVNGMKTKELKTMWNNIFNEYNEVMHLIQDYNQRINNCNYIETNHELDKQFFDDLVSAQIINCLIDDPNLYVPKELINLINKNNSRILRYVDWKLLNDNHYVITIKNFDKNSFLQRIINYCFSESGKSSLYEICAQDIIYSGNLAPKIKSFLGSIKAEIKLSCLGIASYSFDDDESIDKYIDQINEAIASGKFDYNPTKLEKAFSKTYRNQGALVRTREFKHNYSNAEIPEKIIVSDETENALDYRFDGNFCQSAILHIGIEETGSSGTGFKISPNYALTCAHVVENAKEIYANVICGDGYPRERFDGFEVYDVGFCEVIYTNKQLDIALLKTEDCGSEFLKIEDRKLLPELGEEVVVFGYPLGYEMPQTNRFGPNISFYKGYVSSNQIVNENSVTFLDINVKSGNSGSPVISTKTGKVIGIISGAKVGGILSLVEKMPYMIPIQHFLKLNK